MNPEKRNFLANRDPFWMLSSLILANPLHHEILPSFDLDDGQLSFEGGLDDLSPVFKFHKHPKKARTFRLKADKNILASEIFIL
jgi:hypothetical protein